MYCQPEQLLSSWMNGEESEERNRRGGHEFGPQAMFSALVLASVAELEANQPFLGAPRYHQLVTDAITYLQRNATFGAMTPTSLDPRHGATADLLQALAASPLLRVR